jgi:hypothetical protein
MKALYGHTSEETAYLVQDYPYGFKLRCQMKVWLEYRDGKGFRMVTRTSNPKKPGTWNKEKASTYCAVAGNLFLDENSHIHWTGISGWEDQAKLEKFVADFPESDKAGLELVKALIRRHIAKAANPIK